MRIIKRDCCINKGRVKFSFTINRTVPILFDRDVGNFPILLVVVVKSTFNSACFAYRVVQIIRTVGYAGGVSHGLHLKSFGRNIILLVDSLVVFRRLGVVVSSISFIASGITGLYSLLWRMETVLSVVVGRSGVNGEYS